MPKKQGRIESGKAILAAVKKEMAKPRMVKSVNPAAPEILRGKRGKTKL